MVTFEKYHGLERNGIFEADHWALLDTAVSIPFRADTPDRVEVDLGRQILILVLERPSGRHHPDLLSQRRYLHELERQHRYRPNSRGRLRFYREEDGWYRSYLGGLYEPFFFRGGYAIHGSNSVPAYPASHGCIRTQIADQDWLKPQLEVGMPVFVYGQRTPAPEDWQRATGNG